MDSVWTPLIAAKPAMNGTGVDTKTGIALLDIYWTWLHPLHHLVYRPAFVMDLALGGPHCSDFLLLCIFALAARHLPSEGSGPELGSARGEEYATRARTLLLGEMTAARPSIPTIQGLLILGGRQCAIGSSSQGWLYTGMAIRMMQDVGLHLDTTRLAGVAEKWTPTELEVRKRLYNAAYVWDKTLSLALGRPPTLLRRPYPAFELFDKYDDGRLWQPVHAKEVVDSFAPSPSWVTSTLCVFSSLHEITTDMLLLFSRAQGTRQFDDQVSDLDARFWKWYADIPDGMKISQPSALTQSPPPHIVSLNLLYHTLHILLRRPFLGDSRKVSGSFYAAQCLSHSKSIHEIHTLYTKTFPHRLMTYQVSYCIYTAATVEALELKSVSLSPEERSGAAARLTAAVRILQNEANHTPGSGKSLDTIRRLLTEGERANVRGRRHSSRRKRRPTNQALTQQGATTGNAQTFDPETPIAEMGPVTMQDAGRSGLQQAVQESNAPGPGPATTNTGGSSEFSVEAQGYSGNDDANIIAVSNFTDHPIGLGSSTNHNGPFGQDVGNAFGIDAGMWGLDAGFCGGMDTGAGFHPEAFSFVYTGDSELPRIPEPVAPAVPPSMYLYSPNPGWSARNWPGSGQ
ncbi:fungal-specific transcription factor domain-containing protein [Stachybotrys elegans]|uniref:Fungal-specific transcription factor domain-containing protein n=1 Tax=Stachybotrys elegans TaxID=80388 RepID=A0A8K0T9A7_9HYPO|nr:fungal-specific transcription factor domain-containing protein [Stachybotrys elegans]